MEIPVDDGIVLYTYWRSSAAYRVRIGLELKGLAWEARPVHLVRDGGEQHRDAYRALNPQQQVPTLLHEGHVLTQSLAILEYLDERFPQVPLLPADAAGRARVRALAQLVACDIHPINNLRVMQYQERSLQLPADARTQWTLHWIAEGFAAMEALLANSRDTGAFCHGDRPGLADICLLPQLYNAHRFGLDLAPYPTLRRIEAACQALDAFDRARPEHQLDAA
ncbi:maleylacetoacetate isomerase [Stenotrophomonas pavanii]|uniref:maleylacetoacetate isomerase n=1 Tax=Stenotrophomonas TaxID=40323 RepID=UPI0006C67B2F|nr:MULTISPECIES: maleylacetoacetate isomerase [Stenotrophomonas]KAA3599630.1 maleylacetoacetate isomerase [Stenotrophomonas maltophilia]KOO77577.1 maleylacetoacetate isomerase [Stenotrophomonas maltophilia]MBN5176428.1 maleylacetoacetate isomerase [Stenotrophomonas maltophilia]MCU1121516.1 maleylacetoacetate isomerase [Stenotrophomonas maltophilia]MDQ7276936.1 maleylacetoacetate isomerase [Stenotrophomonas sp. Sm3147]